jgi:4-amino-4-deoxy-L-arabinose transferase-like glycosyltransferase
VTAPSAADEARRTRTVLVLLTVAFVVSGAAFAVLTPLFENPDEATHVDMVEHYVEHPTKMAGPSLRQTQKVRGAFAATGLFDTPTKAAVAGLPPTRPDYGPFRQYGGEEPATSCPVTCQNYQFAHPPLWYLTVAPVAWVLQDRPFPDTVLALRLINVLFGAVMVWATWSIALSLWPGRGRRALLAAACTACCGPLAAAAASVNNDGLMMPLMAVALALIAMLLRRGATGRSAAVLGLVVAVGLLTKIEFLVISVVGLGAVLLAPVANGRERGKAALSYLAVGGIGGLWHLRVILDTHSLTPRGGELLGPTRRGPWSHVGFLHYLRGRLGEAFDRFPGRYGWQLANLPEGLLTAVKVGTVALVVVWLVCRRWRRPTIATARVLVLLTAPVLLLLASAFTAWQSYHRNGEEHGLAPRYGYGTVPVLSVALIAALVALHRRWRPGARAQRALEGAFVVGLGVLGVLVSEVVSAHAVYFTTRTTLLFQRAGIVAPLAHVKAYLAALLVIWLAAMVAVVWGIVRARPAAHSPRSDLGQPGTV